MIPRPYLYIAFGLMAVLQLALPLRTVVDYESTLRNGDAYKFATRPIDPNDPFRGKYVTLDFVPIEDELPTDLLIALGLYVSYGQSLYLIIEKDARGYARAVDLRTELPTEEVAYVPVTAGSAKYRDGQVVGLNLHYPFDRFYLEESKAPRAEARYREALRRDSVETYAVVHLRDGVAVIADVMIDGMSLVE